AVPDRRAASPGRGTAAPPAAPAPAGSPTGSPRPRGRPRRRTRRSAAGDASSTSLSGGRVGRTGGVAWPPGPGCPRPARRDRCRSSPGAFAGSAAPVSFIARRAHPTVHQPVCRLGALTFPDGACGGHGRPQDLVLAVGQAHGLVVAVRGAAQHLARPV